MEGGPFSHNQILGRWGSQANEWREVVASLNCPIRVGGELVWK